MNPDIDFPARRQPDGFATIVDLASRFDRPSPVSANRCWRCGATDVNLVNDPYISRRKRCHPDLPCVGGQVDTGWQQATGYPQAPHRPKPTCPDWCVEVHGDPTDGGWRHRSATFETPLHQTGIGQPDRFDAALMTWEHVTGEYEPIAVCFIGNTGEFRMTAEHARQLSNTLDVLATTAEPTGAASVGRTSGDNGRHVEYPPNLSRPMTTPAA